MLVKGINTLSIRNGDYFIPFNYTTNEREKKMLVLKNHNDTSIILKFFSFFQVLWRDLIMKAIYAYLNKDVVDVGQTKSKTEIETLNIIPICRPMQDLHIEENRLASFYKWSSDVVTKEKLALVGFYHCGPEDTVKCYFCKVEIGHWEIGDNAYTEHKRWAPNCPLLNRNTTDNIPKNSNELNELLPQRSYDICGSRDVEYRNDAFSESAFATVSEDIHLTSDNQYGDYAIESERLTSFMNWPKAMKQKPIELSDAGFFYIGKGDAVKCFSCGGGLKDWEEEDLPWEQHALWYSKCRYLNLMKGSEYIEEIQAKHNPDHKIVEKSNVEEPILPSSVEENLSEESDSKLCKICYTKEFNTVFFPCGHIIACVKCASSLKVCPVCRKEITDIKRVYFS